MRVCSNCGQSPEGQWWHLNSYFGISGFFCPDCFRKVSHNCWKRPENTEGYIEVALEYCSQQIANELERKLKRWKRKYPHRDRRIEVTDAMGLHSFTLYTPKYTYAIYENEIECVDFGMLHFEHLQIFKDLMDIVAWYAEITSISNPFLGAGDGVTI